MTKTTVSTTEYVDADGRQREQYRTTIPKALAEALDLGGATVEWEVESGSRLSLTKVDD